MRFYFSISVKKITKNNKNWLFNDVQPSRQFILVIYCLKIISTYEKQNFPNLQRILKQNFEISKKITNLTRLTENK